MNYRMLEMDDVSIFFVFLFINLSYNCNFQNQNVCGVRMQGVFVETLGRVLKAIRIKYLSLLLLYFLC